MPRGWMWDMWGTSTSHTRKRSNSPEYHRLPSWQSVTSPRSATTFIRSRTISLRCKILTPLVIMLLLISPLLVWEPHIELAFYNRSWVKQEVLDLLPLSETCFDPQYMSPHYNATAHIYAPKQHQVHAGLPLRLGMDCYNFAGTIKPTHDTSSQWVPPEKRTHYHTYWRNDLAPFAERQEWLLKSFFATQNTETSRLVLWSNGDLSGNEVIQKWLNWYPDAFVLKVVDYDQLAQGTRLAHSDLLKMKDTKAWIDGDLVRLLVLWAYGGVWVDMDSLLTRDLAPLFEHEFVTQWDCYDKQYVPFNGALMHFQKHSPYLCEAFHIMATSQPPREGSTDWGATLYLKLWRRLVAASIQPFSVLPWCFSDGRSCRLDNRLPDPFTPDPLDKKWTFGLTSEEGGGLDRVVNSQIFSVHLHNQWTKPYPKGGWVERLLLKRYDQKLRRPTLPSERRAVRKLL